MSKLLEELLEELPKGYEFTPVELTQIQLAQSQLDDIDRLQAELDSSETIVNGHTGQPRLNSLFSELRQQRHEATRQIEVIRRGIAADNKPVKSGTRYTASGSRVRL